MLNEPEKTFRAVNVEAAVWLNETEKDGKKIRNFSVTIQKSYKDDDGNWKTTKTFFRDDLPKLRLVIDKAYEFIALY